MDCFIVNLDIMRQDGSYPIGNVPQLVGTAPMFTTNSCYYWSGERFNEIVGSPNYMAPEVFKRNYGPEVDVWSARLSSIFYFVVCHHSGKRLSRGWHKQLFALLLTLRGTHGLRFRTMQRTL